MKNIDKKETIKKIKHISLVALTVGSIISTGVSIIDSSKKETLSLEADRLRKNAVIEIYRNDEAVNAEIKQQINENLDKLDSGKYGLNEVSISNKRITTQENIEKVIKSHANNENKHQFEVIEKTSDQRKKSYDEASKIFFASATTALAGSFILSRDARKKNKEKNQETENKLQQEYNELNK